MQELINSIKDNNKDLNQIFTPLFYRLNLDEDRSEFQKLLVNDDLTLQDNIYNQLQELIKCLNPSKILEDKDYEILIKEHIKNSELYEYGVWVYYPWNKRLIHILDEKEFIEVRTNRNRNKITREEQSELLQKKIGIIGLSVGQSIAITMAMERVCGEIRLADFDTVELSNLNRIRTGLQNLGTNKAIVAAREIAEIDPFIKVKVYTEGIKDTNIDSFFADNGNLDLLIEVCDGLDIKIESRLKAKSLKIPVIMDTNDRGMLDIERFDLDPEKSILHGYIDSFFHEGKFQYSKENKLELLNSILSFDSLSDRMKTSMGQIGKTINTWPQLASSVVLGGAITTDASRRILLNQLNKSGRYYVDLEDLIK
jgi:molybdopterin/thiamine biosynthesis adenylyltransferase